MTRTRILAFLLLISFLGNLLLAYRIVDMAVTNSYGAEGYARRDKQIREMEKLFPYLISELVSQANLESAAKKSNLEVIDKGVDGVYVGSIRFVFSEGKLTAVSFD